MASDSAKNGGQNGGRNKVRLNRFISTCGVTSRRKADRLIEEGRVKLNGIKVYEMGVQVDPDKDEVTIDGEVVRPVTEMVYVVFNKPKEVISSLKDPEGRACVGDYFAHYPTRLFPVGRLDWDSEGLIVMTNDGEFGNQILHPKHEVTKTYMVKIKGQPTDSEFERLKRGISIEGGRVSALDITRMDRGSDQYDWIKIVITEGKNRQIHKMFEKIGYDVLKIQRVAIGALTLGSLERGDYREISRKQAEKVFAAYEDRKVQNKFDDFASRKNEKEADSKPDSSKRDSGSRRYGSGAKTRSASARLSRELGEKRDSGRGGRAARPTGRTVGRSAKFGEGKEERSSGARPARTSERTTSSRGPRSSTPRGDRSFGAREDREEKVKLGRTRRARPTGR